MLTPRPVEPHWPNWRAQGSEPNTGWGPIRLKSKLCSSLMKMSATVALYLVAHSDPAHEEGKMMVTSWNRPWPEVSVKSCLEVDDKTSCKREKTGSVTLLRESSHQLNIVLQRQLLFTTLSSKFPQRGIIFHRDVMVDHHRSGRGF